MSAEPTGEYWDTSWPTANAAADLFTTLEAGKLVLSGDEFRQLLDIASAFLAKQYSHLMDGVE